MLNVNSMEELNDLLSKNEKVVLDLWAPWCGPCRVLAPVFQKASENVKDVLFVKANVDEAPDVMDHFKIMSIPTVIYFKSGKEVEKSVGVPSSQEVFEDTISQHLS